MRNNESTAYQLISCLDDIWVDGLSGNAFAVGQGRIAQFKPIKGLDEEHIQVFCLLLRYHLSNENTCVVDISYDDTLKGVVVETLEHQTSFLFTEELMTAHRIPAERMPFSGGESRMWLIPTQ